jgi:hypothetical protein
MRDKEPRTKMPRTKERIQNSKVPKKEYKE